MPYKTGSWGEQAKARYKRRLESGYYTERNRKYKLSAKYKQLVEYKSKLIIDKKCELCGEEKCFYHHKDGDNKNNNTNNLMPICRGCHNKVHKRNPKGRTNITRDKKGRFTEEMI